MSKQINATLKKKLEDLAIYGGLDAETLRNTLKEELQYYVLNFIYHHSEYDNWTMYGGSALRIIHGLNRMSVDLDFEIPHAVTEKFLHKLKKEIEEHFLNTYGTNSDFMTTKITSRGLLLKFHMGEELSFGHSSKQVHVKIDLNHFVAPKTIIERRPINRDQLSFAITAYNMASLMASKIAAVFLRGTRRIGNAIYEEKGRDIYDLLWYMSKRIIPDFDYLIAKKININDPRALFDKLTIQMSKVNDKNLEQDLEPLFLNKTYIRDWLANWRESYFRLLDEYKIRSIKNLEHIQIHYDLLPGIFHFIYIYKTEDNQSVRIAYVLSDYWLRFREGDLKIDENKNISKIVEFLSSGSTNNPPSQEKLKEYAALFYEKNEKYFKKTNNTMLGDSIKTKVIRMTADKLNPKEQIVLNKSALLSCELDDLL